MTKTPTQWVTDIVKHPTPFTSTAKNPDAWSNNDMKTPTHYSSTQKNSDAWAPEHTLQTYFYDDRFTFDDPETTFDGLVNNNTYNQLGQTAWRTS